MKWKNGDVEEVTVLSKLGGNLRIRSYTPLSGKNLKEAKGENSNLLLESAHIAQPIISPQAQFNVSSLRKTYEYDIMTEKGKTIYLKSIL